MHVVGRDKRRHAVLGKGGESGACRLGPGRVDANEEAPGQDKT